MAIKRNVNNKISYICEKCGKVMFTFPTDNPFEYEKNFVNNKDMTKFYYKCQFCGTKRRATTINPKTQEFDILPLEEKDLGYIICLKCDRKIYADEIKYQENNTIVICPYEDCKARNIVRFIGRKTENLNIQNL